MKPLLVILIINTLTFASFFVQSATSNIDNIKKLIKTTPHSVFNMSEIIPKNNGSLWKMTAVTSVAIGKNGLIYVLDRSKNFDPIVVMNEDGKVLRSWGKGLYSIPHSIRIDDVGHVWTVDSGNSHIYKFSPLGEQLLHIDVGEIPKKGSRRAKGTSDISFTADGNIFIADGYGNSRILEYSADGKKINQWGMAGSLKGEFDLVHNLVIDHNEHIYVADRENGRIQKFTRKGDFLGLWDGLGKVYSLFNDGKSTWAGVYVTMNGDTSAYVIKLGNLIGQVDSIVEVNSAHSVTFTKAGDFIMGGDQTKIFKYKMNKHH